MITLTREQLVKTAEDSYKRSLKAIDNRINVIEFINSILPEWPGEVTADDNFPIYVQCKLTKKQRYDKHVVPFIEKFEETAEALSTDDAKYRINDIKPHDSSLGGIMIYYKHMHYASIYFHPIEDGQCRIITQTKSIPQPDLIEKTFTVVCGG